MKREKAKEKIASTKQEDLLIIASKTKSYQMQKQLMLTKDVEIVKHLFQNKNLDFSIVLDFLVGDNFGYKYIECVGSQPLKFKDSFLVELFDHMLDYHKDDLSTINSMAFFTNNIYSPDYILGTLYTDFYEDLTNEDLLGMSKNSNCEWLLKELLDEDYEICKSALDRLHQLGIY